MPSQSTDDSFPVSPQYEQNTTNHKYDVFLCYNTESNDDKSLVMTIGKQLKERKIIPWFDDWEVRPGTPWQGEVEKQIGNISAAAVFVGYGGISHWQRMEIDALLRELLARRCPIIPVYLPNISSKPEFPIFLKGMRPVDFNFDEDPLANLIWGITGKPVEALQPTRAVKSSRVLIALLEESPVAISAIYDILTQREGLMIDQVLVLHMGGEDVIRAFEMVEEALVGACELRRERLPFEEINDWANACLFAKELYKLLETCQARGDIVYLSLAGCNKSTAALITSITTFFPCIEHLYNVIDSDEEFFLSINDVDCMLTHSQKEDAMHPDTEQFTLMDIPLESRKQANKQSISDLLSESRLDKYRPGSDSVLIVPLGKISMIGTQLYTLLNYQERHNIRAVILVYPAQIAGIAEGANLIRKALREEANISCIYASVPNQQNIYSPKACRIYQATLEKVIDQARNTYPGCIIDLTLSGTQAGMLAMTIFAAQKKQLPCVYHMLMTDVQLSETIDQQTTVKALIGLKKEDRNKRLFLRAYDENEAVYNKLVFFKVPVL